METVQQELLLLVVDLLSFYKRNDISWSEKRVVRASVISYEGHGLRGYHIKRPIYVTHSLYTIFHSNTIFIKKRRGW